VVIRQFRTVIDLSYSLKSWHL